MNREGRALLLRKAGEAMWVLPKGTLEPGETDEEAAVREVHEETGLQVKLLRPLMEVRYAFYWPPDGVNVDKTVAYFLATPIGGRGRRQFRSPCPPWRTPRTLHRGRPEWDPADRSSGSSGARGYSRTDGGRPR